VAVEVELVELVVQHHLVLLLVEEVELVELVFQTILQEAVFHTLVVAVEEEDPQMVLHVEQVVQEETQVDQVQEMLELQEQLTEEVVVALVLLVVEELELMVAQE
jgi:hypothetical protein